MKCWSILQLIPTPLGFHGSSDQSPTVLATTTLYHLCSSPGCCREFTKSFAQGQRTTAMGSILNPTLYHNPGSTVHGWEAEKEGIRRVYAFLFFFRGAKLRCSRVGLAIWEKHVGRKNAGREDELPPEWDRFLPKAGSASLPSPA